MTNVTALIEAFDAATANVNNWENGEICMGEVHTEVYNICVLAQLMDEAEFEASFVELEEQYFEEAYEDDKILLPRMWERLTLK